MNNNLLVVISMPDYAWWIVVGVVAVLFIGLIIFALAFSSVNRKNNKTLSDVFDKRVQSLDEKVTSGSQANSENFDEVKKILAEKKTVIVTEVKAEAAPAATPAAAAEPAPVAVSENEPGGIVLHTAPKKTFDENYADLTKQQKKYFDGLIAYALSNEKAEKVQTKNYVVVREQKHPILKVVINKGITTAKFKLENELFKQYRKKSSAKINVKETVLQIVDNASYETAKGLIDVVRESNEKERAEMLEARRQRRNAAQAAKRAAQKASE